MKPLRPARDRLVQWSRWLDRHTSADRWLAIISLAATVVLSVLGILASVSKVSLLRVSVGTAVLLTIITVALVSLMRARRGPPAHLHPYPYVVKRLTVTVDIESADGSLALIRHDEESVCLQDHVPALRRSFWGDWGTCNLGDLTCIEPAGAVVADCFKERYATIFIISLRRLLNSGDKFPTCTELVARDGFRNAREYYTHTVVPPTALLTLRIQAPRGVRFVSEACTVRREVFGQMYYDEWPLPAKDLRVGLDGRQEISYSWDDPKQGQTYGLYWAWEALPLPGATAGRAS